MSWPCPDCPECGNPPAIVLGAGRQAFCETEGCHVLMWNPQRTRAENMADARYMELPDFGDPP